MFLNKFLLVFSASAGMEAKLKCTQMELEKAVEKISVLERLCAEQKEAIETFMVIYRLVLYRIFSQSGIVTYNYFANFIYFQQTTIIRTFDQVPKKNLRILALDQTYCWL
jgi:hypothetical protein